MDRYQDEIRKAAAKSVRDLNLSMENPPLTRSQGRKMSFERRKSPVIVNNVSVSAATARIEQMQRVNGSSTANGPVALDGGRRKSLGHNDGGKPLSPTAVLTQQNLTNQSRIIADFAFGGGQVIHNYSPEANTSQHSESNNGNHHELEQQFRPGTYPQLKRSSLTNIPIYENIDGYPDVVSHQVHQKNPPPYAGSHTIVSSDVLSRRNSRTSVSSLESRITNGGSPGSSGGSKNYPTIAELTNLTQQLNLVQQQPMLKPPILPPKAMSSKMEQQSLQRETQAVTNIRSLAPNYENTETNPKPLGSRVAAHLPADAASQLNGNNLFVHPSSNGITSLIRSDQSSVLFRDYVNLPPPPPYPGTFGTVSTAEGRQSVQLNGVSFHGHTTSNVSAGSNGKCFANCIGPCGLISHVKLKKIYEVKMKSM